MTAQHAQAAPRELFGTVNAVAADWVAAAVGLKPARGVRGEFACVACASSDALNAIPKRGGW